MKKLVVTVIASLLLCFCAVGTTYAWLVAKTEPVKSTFVAGDINISISDTTSLDLKMVPGTYIEDDPKVTVHANSEDCWLFVKVEKSENFYTFLEASVFDENWSILGGTDTVGYRKVSASDTDQEYQLLKKFDGTSYQVYVKDEITKAQFNRLTESEYPYLSFTAYAVQQIGFDTAEAAWAEAQKLG